MQCLLFLMIHPGKFQIIIYLLYSKEQVCICLFRNIQPLLYMSGLSYTGEKAKVLLVRTFYNVECKEHYMFVLAYMNN